MTPTDGETALKTYPPHSRPVRLVRGDLPSGTDYEVLGKVKAIKASNGRVEDVERVIADDARKIGADAVIQLKTWYAPRAFSWAAPHAEGIAVKLQNRDAVELEKLPGVTF